MPTTSTVLPPVIIFSQSTVYAIEGDVYALEASSGTLRHRYPINGLAHPTVVNDVLYLNVSRHPDYLIQALRGYDDTPLWSYKVEGRVAGIPVIVDGVVYACIAEGTIYALQASDGTLLWRSINLGPIAFASPTVVDAVVYLAPAVNRPLQPAVYAFQANNGILLWRAQIADWTVFPLAVVGEVIYISVHSGCLALSARDGSSLWQHETRGHTCSPPVVMDGRVYLSLSEDKHEVLSFESGEQRYWQEAFLCALDARDGSLLWEQQLGITTGTGHPTTPHVTPDAIYIGADDGSLCAFQTSDGAPRWHYKTGGALLSSPTGANEVVYVGANDGFVYAFRASDGALLWQTFVSVDITAISSISIHLKKS